jgi:hypothetical protein
MEVMVGMERMEKMLLNIAVDLVEVLEVNNKKISKIL